MLEFAGIGPGPFTVMMLADMGADVIRIDSARAGTGEYIPNPVLSRGRRSIAIDLKASDGRRIATELAGRADVIVESFRPGVMERLGLGPDVLLAANPKLVYGRMTGWGQDGPLAQAAGHDINYISLTGALHAIGRANEAPVPPLNLVGDFGGGSMFLAFGIACALLEAHRSGRGQVVDAAVIDGTTSLLSLIHGLQTQDRWHDERGTNLLDTGTPYYDVYRCADGGYVAVGCIEEKFFLNLLDVLGLRSDPTLAGSHKDRTRWPALRVALTAAFASRGRDDWAAALAGRDACASPVLSLAEARTDPHATSRTLYRPVPGYPDHVQAAPAPRFSRTSADLPGAAPRPGQDTAAILADLGYDDTAIARLAAAQTVAATDSIGADT